MLFQCSIFAVTLMTCVGDISFANDVELKFELILTYIIGHSFFVNKCFLPTRLDCY